MLVYENYPFDRSSGGERSEVGGLALHDGAFSFRTPYPLMWVAKPGTKLPAQRENWPLGRRSMSYVLGPLRRRSRPALKVPNHASRW